MSRGFALCLLVLLSTIVGPAMPALANDQVVDLTELIAFSADRSGETVLIEGEAIGQVIGKKDGHAFVNVLDETTAVGVFMTEQQTAMITGFGGYKTTGSIVRVSGELNVACEQHGGDFDIHATTVDVLAPPVPREQEPLGIRLVLAPLALALGLGQLFIYRRMRARRHLL
jgi:hypothetical protein